MKVFFRIKEIWIHIVIWSVLVLFPMLISFNETGIFPTKMLTRFFINPLLFYINYLIFTPKILLKKRLILYGILSVLVLSIAWYISFQLIPNKLPIELKELSQRNAELPNLNVVKNIMILIISLLFYSLGGAFSLIVDFFKRERKAKELEVQNKETELQFLRTQLNPHFLFNSLNSIYSLVRNKSNDAPESIITLSELMRYMLYEANQKKVSVKKEIEYIKNYVSLQLLRLSNSENVKINIKGEYENKKITPLLLISFIENAFKYGTNFKGETNVDIKMEIRDNTLYFSIKNIIGAYKKRENQSGIGLSNIKNRLELLYQNAYTLNIDEDENYYSVDLILILN